MIQVFHKDDVAVIRVAGRLDAQFAAEFDSLADSLFAKNPCLIIDMSDCFYLSSIGIRSLLKVTKKCMAVHGGLCVISGLQAEVNHVIEISGLQRVFKLSESSDDALQLIRQIQQQTAGQKHQVAGDITWKCTFTALPHGEPAGDPSLRKWQGAFQWTEEGISSMGELNLAIGKGSLAGWVADSEAGSVSDSRFVVLHQLAAFLPVNESTEADYFIADDILAAGIHTKEAISFRGDPSLIMQAEINRAVDWHLIIESARQILQNQQISKSGDKGIMFVVVADCQYENPRWLLGAFSDKPLSAISFNLESWPGQTLPESLPEALKASISLMNIAGVEEVKAGLSVFGPKVWVFYDHKLKNASDFRIKIEAPDDFFAQPHKAFMCRRLFTDSERLQIKPLHGGFSAQTFAVNSYDTMGRRLRPTVMKLAARKIISREAEHCRKYALPYILNNSAQVLGTVFCGEYGALRYNFVGVGGEGQKLFWLRDHYLAHSYEELVPLFDKIFQQILQPWYGQARKEHYCPFADHDPTLSFFANLHQQALQQLGISSDEPFLKTSETIGSSSLQSEHINPYWYLRHEYPRRRTMGMVYQQSICHGDLNMQNILLDEALNVYVIDFSETRPRAVICDYARLEVIFLLEFTRLESEADLQELSELFEQWFSAAFLDEDICLPELTDRDNHKAFAMSGLMRQYALKSVDGNRDIVPYLLAMLEWTLPVVCYNLPLARKKLSLRAASLMVNKLNALLPSGSLHQA